eukprot:CAMPEP_0172456612 /NCGR_PEP_ID=MMETSP1065-20121228/16611_1 /TAXON_ID=265537 /ORGANISM="Amphiprora paludosa, Strain CCMP125" /LENGTH=36 /DNA_ID= /DNA_START= /DNA_END= /DNA_ORIENTATION=
MNKNVISEIAGLPPPDTVQALMTCFAQGSFDVMKLT